MKPHKEQEGYKYVRVRSHGRDENGIELFGRIFEDGVEVGHLAYDDENPGARIISSKRVERAVETDDFIKRLLSEGLDATVDIRGWCVSNWAECGFGPTIRAAYENYRARIAQSASDDE